MKTTNNFIDRILPTFGNVRDDIPIYCDSHNMFLSLRYTSSAEGKHYKGFRFTDRLVMIETVGLYNNVSYINSIEVYTFNGEDKVLIGKKDYDKVLYEAEQIKKDAATIIVNYIKDSARIAGSLMYATRAEQHASELLRQMYENPIRSFKALRGAYKQLLLSE